MAVLQVGTDIRKTYNGLTYVIRYVAERRFEMDGETYSGLTAVAQRICGDDHDEARRAAAATWRFFGLDKDWAGERVRRPQAAASSSQLQTELDNARECVARLTRQRDEARQSADRLRRELDTAKAALRDAETPRRQAEKERDEMVNAIKALLSVIGRRQLNEDADRLLASLIENTNRNAVKFNAEGGFQES